jgi:ornithine carbamoyltransferase
LKHFISLADHSPEEIQELLTLAGKLKEAWRKGGNEPVLHGKSLALVFQKPSLRTRVSFELAMVQLGGYALYLSPNEISMGGRESVPDVARVLSGYVDAIMARVFSHDHILQLAQYATVPVINGLSDYNHPAQGFADLFTILEQKGTLENVTVAYIGDGNNVARSLLFGAMKTGMNFKIATPAGYTLNEEDLTEAEQMRIADSQKIEVYQDPGRAVNQADVIYTDVWTSMGQEAETHPFLATIATKTQQIADDHASNPTIFRPTLDSAWAHTKYPSPCGTPLPPTNLR